MDQRPPPTLERYHEIVPEWTRPPMTERLLAALSAAFAQPGGFINQMELLWMAVGAKPAGQYEIGPLVSWASHWRVDEREVARTAFGGSDPERVRRWREKLANRPGPAEQVLIDELDAALTEAGWRTWREEAYTVITPEGNRQFYGNWSECGICSYEEFPTTESSHCRSANLVAVSDFAARRLSLAFNTEARLYGQIAREIAVGLALGYPINSIEFYVRELSDVLSFESSDPDEREREFERREVRREAAIRAWPDELYGYTSFFVADPRDITLVAEVRRRAEALFGPLPAALMRSTAEEIESRRRDLAIVRAGAATVEPGEAQASS